MTDWQDVISTAAVAQFTRHGRLGAFRLARRDLLSLASQVAKTDLNWHAKKWEGFAAIRCEILCEPLNRLVVVDEWV